MSSGEHVRIIGVIQMQLSLSIEEVSNSTGIGRTKIYEAINRGLLPAKKYGKRTIILRGDLESFLRALESYPSNNSS
jgi:excisionase family DNA binding protein